MKIGFHGVPAMLKEGAKYPIAMLWTLFFILVILWLLGMITSYTFGGFIHLLLILAIAVVLIRVIQGKDPM
jgi:hypothetical protein